ncbi:hypothetical protein H072_2478 [Dactylellina haptotyla CBS 200.50]|uniref:SWIM-type domain-containing protein n=1 Tax=Dactylellina haptotyla (strain CBS 200.50) TaxID=1284197 RepID=S8C735_DACHA|nr:hypothetical protein H072_2478 [Dactylellina haptotyla CBS 200.50]
MPATEHDELAEFNGIKPKVLLKDGETREIKSESSGSTTYTVKRTYDHFYCTCPGWRNNGGPVNARTCKHLKNLLGEAYEWERIEDKNPGVQPPLKGRKATTKTAAKKDTKKKAAAVTGNVRDRKRKVEDDKDEDEDEDEEEEDEGEVKPKAKRSKVKVEEDSDEDEEMTFSDLDTMDPQQLEAEKSIMVKRMERINTLLTESKSKGKGLATASTKAKRTITGKGKKRAVPDDDDEEEDEDEDEEEDDDCEAPQPPNSKLRPQLLLAEKWDLEKGIDPTGWWMSEKLDGVRAYWNGSTFLSREGNKFYAPDWFTKKFPKDLTLDGELTCGRGKFIDTVSIVKTINGGDKWKFSVEYHVFDIPSMGNKKFEQRQESLKKLLDGKRIKWVKYVDQTEVEDKDHVLKELERITELGGEGLMLREPESVYIQKRSKTCLKVKTFHDAEAKVIGHEEGKGRNQGRCGALKCEMMDGSKKTFKVGTGLDDKTRKNPPKVGTVITYRYFELTKDGVPRFPSFMRVFKGH